MAEKKPLEKLNLLDRFLFAEAMEDPVIMANTLEIILGREVVLDCLPQAEKEQRISTLKRFIKLDVWARDVEDVIYDTEVQKRDTKNLPKRSRYYQALIDSKLLKPGEIDFNMLNKVYVIIIMPFDLFGQGLYRYTFQMQCGEAPEIELGDGAVRIFLNTHGTNPEGVSQELIDLLYYMEHTDQKTSAGCTSIKIRDMQERIEAIKSSEEVGVRYMQEWEERELDKREARELGRKDGQKEGADRVNRLNRILADRGRADDIIKAAVDKEYQEKLFEELGVE